MPHTLPVSYTHLDGPEAGYKVTYTQADAEAVKAH